MKIIVALLLILGVLTGCASAPAETTAPAQPEITTPITGEIVDITLMGSEISVSGDASGVHTSRDIVYYEQKTAYESGNPYGEGEDWEMHTAEEAAAHLVVNITAPGTYRLRGTLDQGQIRIDLGEDAYENPSAVVNLILDGAEITCTVAPAILFANVYECDGNWSADTSRPDMDTSAAGANLILAEGSENIVSGSHVAKIFKDQEGEKKLCKQDGAIYSYMSLNVWGPGTLDLTADNEGLDTELHLTIQGGDLRIRSGNDGINTNEDGVSVTTINGGNVHIIAGLGEEGDGIDSNGYLVINGGTVMAFANPAADAGLDSDLGSYIHGGTVLALGSAMDWAESDSGQVTMNLQFAECREAGSSIVITRDGAEVFCYDPAEDENLGDNARSFQGAIVSCPDFRVGDSYEVFVGGVQMAYTGTDVMMHPGGMGGFGGGERPEGGFPGGAIPPGHMPEPPEGDFTIPPQPGAGNPGQPQGGMPGGQTPPGDHTMPSIPEGEKTGGMGGKNDREGEKQILFFMQDKVNFFSGLTEAE